MKRRATLCCCTAILLSAAAAARAHAQIVPIKTSPLAEGDQFTFLPSANRGMADVSIAVRDTLLDPFLNPAAGARLRNTFVFGSPSFYSLTRNGTAGSTFPLGYMKRRGALFGAVAVAVQVVEPPGREDGGIILEDASSSLFAGTTRPRSETNRYVSASVGRTLADSTLGVAASVQWSRLRGVDGADLLYPGSDELRQAGDNVDLRVGAIKEWSAAGGRTRSLEAVVLHQRLATRHDVSYLDFYWDPATRTTIPSAHTDVNFDRRHTWGLHLDYDQPIVDSTWRLGAMVTANRTTQPTVPTLGNMMVSGDPGRSAAFNAGVGVSRTVGPATAAIDAVFEPIWAQRRTPGGDAPDRYRFANGLVRAGVGREFALAGPATALRLQTGMEWHRFHYSLDERAGTPLMQRTRATWNEWTHAFGATLRSTRYEFRYAWRMLSGVQRPGTQFFGPSPVLAESIFAPQFPTLEMLAVHVITQQFSFSVRLP